MTLSLRAYERTFPQGEKKWQQKILGVIRLQNDVKDFIFGRNAETRFYLKEIMGYSFIAKEQGKVSMLASGKGYLYTPLSKKRSYMQSKLSFLGFNFGSGETEIVEPIAVKVGDKIIYREEKKEIVLEIIQIY